MLGTVCCSYGWGGLSPGPLLGTEGWGDVGSPFLCVAAMPVFCPVSIRSQSSIHFGLWCPDLPIYSLAYRPFVVCMPNWRLLFTWWNYVCMLLWFVREMMERPVSWGGLVYEGALILKNTPLSLHQISLCPALHPSPFLHLSGCFSFKLCTNLKFKEIIHSKKCCCFFLTHSVNACLKWMSILFWPYKYPHYLLTNLTIRLWSCNHTQWKTRPLRLGRQLSEAGNHC